MNLDCAPFANRIDPLMGLSLDVDAVLVEAKDSGEVGANRVLMGGEFRALEDDGGVEVFDAPAERRRAIDGVAEEDLGVLGVVARVGVGEDLADVGKGEGAEHGIGDGVVEGVAIGVGHGAGVMGDRDSTEDEGSSCAGGGAGLEAVEVVAVPDAGFAHRGDFTRGFGSGFEPWDSAARPRRVDTVTNGRRGASVLGPVWSDL